MAEKALYDNSKEPEFPFQEVIPHLGWLEQYLASREKKPRGADIDYFPSLLDTVLVWSRARTAGYHPSYRYRDCQTLARLLNATLERASPFADDHQLRLVPFGRRMFFVTCRNSPRFNWRTRLMHIEIGRNIDYSAPGHYGRDQSVQRASVRFLERTTFSQLSVETAYCEALKDPVAKDRWVNFNRTKERLYNYTMAKLGLKYRFKCVFEFPTSPQEIHSVMIGSNPPAAQWWDDHCSQLVVLGEKGTSCVFFCNFQTKYCEYWELIRCVYSFGLKYFNLDGKEISSHCGFNFSQRMHRVVKEVYQKTMEKMSPDEYDSLLNHVRSELQILSAAAEDYLEWNKLHENKLGGVKPVSRFSRIQIYVLGTKRKISYRLVLFGRNLYMNIFERWKSREPLVHDGLPIPKVNGCLAYEFFM